MESQHFQFWQMAYNYKWVTIEQLLFAVKSTDRPCGQITSEEYQLITGFEYPETK